jgi:hypothetical protein
VYLDFHNYSVNSPEPSFVTKFCKVVFACVSNLFRILGAPRWAPFVTVAFLPGSSTTIVLHDVTLYQQYTFPSY